MIQVRLLKPFAGNDAGAVIRIGPEQAARLFAQGVAESLDVKPVKKAVEPAPVEAPAVAAKTTKKKLFTKK